MKKLLKMFFSKPEDPYPKTVAEVLDDDIKYRKGTCDAIRNFKESHPWNGSKEEIQDKFRKLVIGLSQVYGIEPPQLIFVKKFVYGSCYFPVGNLIIMEEEKDGKYSTVVLLHEYGHSLGMNEMQTCKWSINLFRKFWPKSFAKLKPKGHLLYKK